MEKNQNNLKEETKGNYIENKDEPDENDKVKGIKRKQIVAIFVTLWLLVLLIGVVMIMKANNVKWEDVVEEKPQVVTLMYADGAEINATIDTTYLAGLFSSMKKQARLSTGVFIGDSITEGLGIYGYVPVERLIAKKGLTVEQASKKMKKIKKMNSNYIYLLLGTNDLNYKNKTIKGIKKEYEKFVKKIHKNLPEAHIYIESVFPVTAEFEKHSKITNKRIDKFNLKLQGIAQEFEYVTYVDIANGLKNKKGKLKKSYSADGYHLTLKGYDIWLGSIDGIQD